MDILDIDLDAFVEPAVFHRARNDPRPPDDEHTILPFPAITRLLRRNWKTTAATPLIRLEHHDEILDAVARLIATGRLEPPFRWVRIDAHDDFWGTYDLPVNFANFMYEVVRRGWCSEIVWGYQAGCMSFPEYILFDNPRFEVRFQGFAVPIRFDPYQELKSRRAPNFAFLCRSPAFSPPKADALYDHIADLCATEPFPVDPA